MHPIEESSLLQDVDSLKRQVKLLETRVQRLSEEKEALGKSIQCLIDNSHEIVVEKINLAREVNILKEDKNYIYRERNILLAFLCNILYSADPSIVERWLHPVEDKDWEEDWRNIIVIQLNEEEQYSWHIHDSELYLFHWLPLRENKWNGHTTEDKYRRIINYVMNIE
ncbi:hypothetical protein H6G33_09460 [Calothrix sp. FACHB-1219]|uniref:hypothetical protein n=1 Tax=unclassified Calothrix TaxID=2619626 RepID=UPI0016853FDA|nr:MULTISPECIES: hypothetical protein [unclassified Calothrix]MBD2201573.1 hypothetical protein [Calothrix sp. FACHB-168]MBD2217259.1 hypothetical protein [Calothrix sp. FACHB-1219]